MRVEKLMGASVPLQGAHLKYSYTNTQSTIKKCEKKMLLSFPKAMLSLVLERLGEMRSVTGVLGWRAISSLGGIDREGEVEVLHCT